MNTHSILFASMIALCSPFTGESQWASPATIPFPNGLAAIDFAALDPRVIWCNSVNLNGGVSDWFARSTDGGATWNVGRISGVLGMDNGSIAAVDSLTAWATTRDPHRTLLGGVYKTTNGGASWLRQSSAYGAPGGMPMAIHFWDADTGVVVGERNRNSWEIYTTSDGGTTWTLVPPANIPANTGDTLTEGFEHDVLGNSIWFCTSTGRVFRSRDRGQTWTAAAIGPGYGRVHSVAFQDQDIGLATSFVNGNPTSMKTTDGGDTWFHIPPPTVPTPHILAHVPGTTGVYVVTGHEWPGTLPGSAYTTDGGMSWKTIDAKPYGPPVFVAPNVGWVGGGGAGLKGNTERWIGTALTYVSPTSISFGTVVLDHSSDTISVTISNGALDSLIVSSISYSLTSSSLIDVAPLPATVPRSQSMQFKAVCRPTTQGAAEDTLVILTNHPTDPSIRIPMYGKGWGTFAGALGSTLYATSAGNPEGGLNTIDISTGESAKIGTLGVPELQSLAVQPATGQVYGVYAIPGKTSLLRVDMESGTSAYERSIPVGNLRAITFSGGDTLYGGTTTGSLYRIDLSTGNAELVGTAAGLSYGGLVFSPTTHKLWSSAFSTSGPSVNDSVYTVNLTTGAATAVGSTGLQIGTSSIAFTPQGELYGLTGSGANLFISINTQSGEGMEVGSTVFSNFRALAMNVNPISSVEVSPDERVPQTFSLSQNYPNPFNPTTIIRYGLPRPAHVSLSVYNTLGQSVAELVNQDMGPGFHEVKFNAKGMASGVYFYTLIVEGRRETKKLLLVQ
jgi:photosystem II stability/assembly factor-like uncharacterized protein